VRPGVEEFVRSRRYVLGGRADRVEVWEVGKEGGPPIASFPMEDDEGFDRAAEVFDRLVAADRWGTRTRWRLRTWIGPLLPTGEPRDEDRGGGTLLAAIAFVVACASVARWIIAGSDIRYVSAVSGLRVDGGPVLAAGIAAFAAGLLLIAHVRPLWALSVTATSGVFVLVRCLVRALSLSMPQGPFSWRVVEPAPWIAAVAGGVMLVVSLGLLFRRSSLGPTPSLTQLSVFAVTCASVATALVIEDRFFGCSPYPCLPRDRTMLRIGIGLAIVASSIVIVALSRARLGKGTS
jgi:hypothetical protein